MNAFQIVEFSLGVCHFFKLSISILHSSPVITTNPCAWILWYPSLKPLYIYGQTKAQVTKIRYSDSLFRTLFHYKCDYETEMQWFCMQDSLPGSLPCWKCRWYLFSRYNNCVFQVVATNDINLMNCTQFSPFLLSAKHLNSRGSFSLGIPLGDNESFGLIPGGANAPRCVWILFGAFPFPNYQNSTRDMIKA